MGSQIPRRKGIRRAGLRGGRYCAPRALGPRGRLHRPQHAEGRFPEPKEP